MLSGHLKFNLSTCSPEDGYINIPDNKKSLQSSLIKDFTMETAGVEPASRDFATSLSTCVVHCLISHGLRQ